MGKNLDAVRAAVAQAKIVAGEFHTGVANFYEDGNAVPIYANIPCRVKKPKPSAFDAGNSTQKSTKRGVTMKIPQNAISGVIRQGLIVQVTTPDGDPTINKINFYVDSALSSQFSAEREVVLTTEVRATPRVS